MAAPRGFRCAAAYAWPIRVAALESRAAKRGWFAGAEMADRGSCAVSRATRQLMAWLAWAALGVSASLGGGDIPIARAVPSWVEGHGRPLVVRVAGLPDWAVGGRLILARDDEPLDSLEWTETFEGGAVFAAREDLAGDFGLDSVQVWVIGPNLPAHLRPVWPGTAELFARVDTVGLGARSVWIDAGTDLAVQVGDCWWRRAAGQPVTRYDVRWVGSDLCYCRAEPLVAGVQPRRGETVALWPAPGLQRAGRAVGAVSLVESGKDDQLVWVAVPSKIDAPAEPRVDFQRGGKHVCGGVVERRDARFWYVRTVAGTHAADVRIGDDALIRTAVDVDRRRIAARVFELTQTGGLINAGEIDGLNVGDQGTIWRAARQIGSVELVKVQRGYSDARVLAGGQIATTLPSPSEVPAAPAPGGLQRLDEVRFGPPASPAVRLGVIERVVEETLFSARIEATRAAPLRTPLEVRRAGRTIGVALLLDLTDGRALGFAVARSLATPLAVGDVLTLTPE